MFVGLAGILVGAVVYIFSSSSLPLTGGKRETGPSMKSWNGFVPEMGLHLKWEVGRRSKYVFQYQ